MQRSILGQLLPEAMVCYLENHGAEKFAQIFLGEWDTPEAIWNSEMRFVAILLCYTVFITTIMNVFCSEANLAAFEISFNLIFLKTKRNQA